MNVVNLRPKNFDEFVGKEEIINNLKICINSVLKYNSNLDHMLFYGYPGIGKTSLATVIANEAKTSIHYIQGGSIKLVSDVLDMVSMINENDIIFVDEIHNIDSKCIELFYSILDDFVVDVKIGKELNSQFSRLKLPKFTFICSTTHLGRLPKPFIDRFAIKFFIDEYSEAEIIKILSRLQLHTDVKLTNHEINIISHNSKGIPRIAINIYKRYLDYKINDKYLDCEQILKAIGIYKYGLEKIDINYLSILYLQQNHPIGLNAISQQLFVDVKTIENNIEPYLIKKNLIIRTSHGRMLTTNGLIYMNEINRQHI